MLLQVDLADELGLGHPTESIAIIEGTELVCFAPTVLVPGPRGKGFALSIHLLIPSEDKDAFRIVETRLYPVIAPLFPRVSQAWPPPASSL